MDMFSLRVILLLTWCSWVRSFDLGPIVRIAQCRSQCLKKHSVDGTCDWFSNRGETVCSECWQNCESLENQWEDTRAICEGEQYSRCPACQTACQYRQTRVEENYWPSMLPAPNKGPVMLHKNDVAILLRKVHKEWKESGYYSGGRTPSLRQDTWIIVVVEDGVRHYSWEEWVPTLESLKEGPLFEATVSWKDLQLQLKRQRDLEQKRFNDRVRQFFLEKYGEKVLAEWRSHDQDSPISDDVFRRFFFRRKDEQQDSRLMETRSDTSSAGSSSAGDKKKPVEEEKESFVVSWEPETGGLMGNQVTDSDTAQISLLPGTKYLVRIASNDGPGSFPIEVDTRPSSVVHVRRIKRNLDDIYLWAILAATLSAVLSVSIALLVKMWRRNKSMEVEEEV